MKLSYTYRASRQLKAISAWISRDNPGAARRVRDQLRKAAETLTVFPNLGRPGVQLGTRELVVPRLPYVIVHRVERSAPGTITILGVYHTAQLRPGQPRTADED